MRLLTILLLILGVGSPLCAQRVVVTGADRDTTVNRLRDVLVRDTYLVLDRDTTLDAASRVEGDLIVVDARVYVEGAVAGSIVVLPGELFIRPGARVGGDVIEAGGSAYPSNLAETGALIPLDARISAALARTPTGYELVLTEPPPPPRPAHTDGLRREAAHLRPG